LYQRPPIYKANYLVKVYRKIQQCFNNNKDVIELKQLVYLAQLGELGTRTDFQIQFCLFFVSLMVDLFAVTVMMMMILKLQMARWL